MSADAAATPAAGASPRLSLALLGDPAAACDGDSCALPPR